MSFLSKFVTKVVDGEFDCRGLVFFITGGNKGLGLETAKRLYRGGGTVVLACRDPALFNRNDGTALLEFLAHFSIEIHLDIVWHDDTMFSVNCQLHVIQCDLACLKSVMNAAKRFRQKFARLDCLICNAGVMITEDVLKDAEEAQLNGGRGIRTTTAQGFELHFGVNHLGHFYLIELLLDMLKPYGRLVMVSSSLFRHSTFYFNGPIGVGTLETEGGFINHGIPLSYCDSKAMNAITARYIALKNPNMTVSIVSPGWCRTGLGKPKKQMGRFKRSMLKIAETLLSESAESGCDTIVFCAVSPSPANQELVGLYYKKRKAVSDLNDLLSSLTYHKGRMLWDYSERLIIEFTDSSMCQMQRHPSLQA